MTDSNLRAHVTFCARGDRGLVVYGSQAESKLVDYVAGNLPARAGDFQVLVNYNLPVRGSGSTGVLEIDALVIDRYGVFVLEVKDWKGPIDAYADRWVQGERPLRDNPFVGVEHKARVLHGTWFGRGRPMAELGRVPVVGLVVLAQGKRLFHNHANIPDRCVVGIDHELLAILAPPGGPSGSAEVLSDEQIALIKKTLYQQHEPGTAIIVGDYRIVKKLSPGDLFEAFEALNIHVPTMRVRIKRYALPSLKDATEEEVEEFKRGTVAWSRMGNHPNILQTLSFFPDSDSPNVFYEVTELPRGRRLDEIMHDTHQALSLSRQIAYLKPLCAALMHAHHRGIYHRNLGPETVYVTEDRVVKLADFDFAKVVGQPTISRPGEVLVESPTSAPEAAFAPSQAREPADIYSLGALWYFLALLPEKSTKIDRRQIDRLNLPPATRQLMTEMLRSAPDDRPQAVKVVVDQLQEILDASKESKK